MKTLVLLCYIIVLKYNKGKRLLINTTIYKKNYLSKVDFPSVTENLECDIAIVGGGLAGLSLAYQLAHHNKKFILIEAQKIGEGASGINGGFCSPGWSVDYPQLCEQYGRSAAQIFYNLSLEGLQWVSSFKSKKDFELIEKRGGTVSLSLLQTEEFAREVFNKSDLIIRNQSQFIPKEQLSDYIKSSKYSCGVLSKSGFSFNPLNFLNSLKNQINLKKPKTIFENSKMQSFSEGNGGCSIKMVNGCKIQARQIVLATGGYGGNETGYLKTRWLPITTSIAVSSPLKKEVRNYINPDFAFSDDRRAGNYYRLMPDNRLLWGRGINAVGAPNVESLQRLVRKDISFFFPKILDLASGNNDLTFDFSWSGKMAYSLSMMPYVGQLSDRTFALTGFGGHGMNTAPAAAIVLSEFLLGLTDRVSIFKKVPMKWNGYHFGAYAAEALYRLMVIKDKINYFVSKRTAP